MATKAELEKQIAELQAKLPDTQKDQGVLSGDIDGAHDGLNLYIREEVFECRRIDVSYQMMKFAVAQRKAQVVIPKNMPDGPRKTELLEQRNAAGMSLMDTMLSTVMALLKPHERVRFDTYMEELALSDKPLNPGEFQEAIGDVIAAAGGQEGKGKAEGTTSSPSYSSLQTTTENSVDDSLHKVGVRDKYPANQ